MSGRLARAGGDAAVTAGERDAGGGLRIESIRRPGLQAERFEVAPGECLPVMGPSGSGKTLFLRAVADLDPNAGEVSAGGVVRSKVPAPQWRRRVSYLAAEAGWWAATVGEHFEDRAAVARLAPELGLPEDCADWSVDRLSTGERQRLALARVLARGPRVLLLDEPTGALDTESVGRVEALIRRYLDGSACALWVTHDPAQARRLNSRRRLDVEAGVVSEARGG